MKGQKREKEIYIFKQLLDKIYEASLPCLNDIEQVLSISKKEDIDVLFDYADKVKKDFVGPEVLNRGVIEFSNKCINECKYCGINKNNKDLERYYIEKKDILLVVDEIAKQGINTVILQSGEDDELDSKWLADIILNIKSKYNNMAVTLSVGEKNFEDYKLWKDAGADRYLLKIETSDKRLYELLHPNMDFDNRLKCLDYLQKLNYQTGSGIIVGLPGQTLKSLACDLNFFKQRNFDMIAVGPLISNKKTDVQADWILPLKILAITRIITKNKHIPATTALASVNKGEDYRKNALKSGANVIMHNFTPFLYRKLYSIYPAEYRKID